MIDAFAAMTGDAQWIHTDPVRAAGSPFGAPIAHGFLTLSVISRMLSNAVPVAGAATVVNYGLNKVRFIEPHWLAYRLPRLAKLLKPAPGAKTAAAVFSRYAAGTVLLATKA